MLHRKYIDGFEMCENSMWTFIQSNLHSLYILLIYYHLKFGPIKIFC